MLKAGILLLIITFLIQGLLPAQPFQSNLNIDSLQRSLHYTTKSDTNKINLLSALSYAYKNNNPDSGLYYGQQAIVLAQKIKWKAGLAKALNCTGNNYFSLSDSANAIRNYQNALAVYQQLKDKDGVAQSLNYIGTVYLLMLSDYLKALPYHEKAFALFQQVKDKTGLASCCENIAIAYESLGNYPQALQMFLQAQSLDEQTHNEQALAINYNHLGIFYDDMHQESRALEYCKKSLNILQRLNNKTGVAHNLLGIGNIYLDMKQYDNAIRYYRQATKLDQQLNDKSGMAKSIGDMGLAYATDLHYEEALKYYKESFKLNKQIGDKQGMADVLGAIGYVYTHAQDTLLSKMGITRNEGYNKALQNLNLAFNISKEMGELDAQEETLQELSEVYEKQNNFFQAYNFYKQYIIIRDSILDDEKKREVANKEMQYSYDKKESALKEQQDKKNALSAAEIKKQTFIKNYILIGVCVGGVFLAFMFTSVNRRRKQKFNNEVMQTEMKALRAQMNPHFIFNSLHSINNYVAENDKKRASEYLLKFSKLMRFILENSREQEVPLATDLQALELYMQLEALQSKTFTYSIQTDENIDKENTLIPPMLLQPFIENAILHGIKHKYDGYISVHISKQNEMLCFEIKDNGSGLTETGTNNGNQPEKHTSLARKIVDERLNIFNRLQKTKASVSISNLINTNNIVEGVKVELLLPLKLAF